ncbi:MAG: GlsB/YeaQ/YmgE family stress response membrane protein [Bacilli bacterium]
MYILLWLIFGALVGWLASILMQKNSSMGLLANIIVGLLGSAIGMGIVDLAGWAKPNAFSIVGVLVSIGGAALLIAVITALKRK